MSIVVDLWIGNYMGTIMSWLYLSLAILFEVGGTVSLKMSNGFSVLGPSVVVVVFYGISILFLALALKTMDVGTAYAVWAGLGTALVAIVGIFYFDESATILKLVFLGMIIAGVVGLHLAERTPGTA